MLIPLGAAAFKSVGRNPLAGMAAAFAGVAAGFGVNFLITPLDGVLTEITNDASALVDPDALDRPRGEPLLRHRLDDLRHDRDDAHLRAASSSPASAVHDPSPRRTTSSLDADKGPEVTPEAEAKGLRYALFATLAVLVGITPADGPPRRPLRDPVTGDIIGDSPFMDSLIVIITIIFFAAGLAYGRGAGTIRTKRRGARRRSRSRGPASRACCSSSC